MPVGFFDSGIGGLSVLNAVRRLLPYENYVYFGDSGNAPYGTRSETEILALSRAAAGRLVSEGVKALVIACNTATGVAGEALHRELPFPVIGIQPALQAAQYLRRGGEILAMATPATFKTQRYAALHARFGEGVISLPCPGLMEFVEREEFHGNRLRAFLKGLLAPYSGRVIDAVVLGCTHYPFLKDAIADFFLEGTPIIDASGEVADRLREALASNGILAPEGERGRVAFLSSGSGDSLCLMERLLQEP